MARIKKHVWIGAICAVAVLLFASCQSPTPEMELLEIIEPTPQVTLCEPAPTLTPSASALPMPRENPFSEDDLLQYAQSVYYSIYYFSDGASFSNGDSPSMPAASVIKVFIMYYAYSHIEHEELTEDDMIGGQTVRMLIERMIQQSDNVATNILIDHFGMETMNQFFLERGFTDTVLQRRMLDMEARSQGLDNYTSTRDSMEFLRRLYHNRIRSPYREMLEIMVGQEIRTKIHLFLPPGTGVANKTGELPDVENDMGLVFTEGGVFAIVVLSDGVRDTAATRQAIGQLALQAYDYARGN